MNYLDRDKVRLHSLLKSRRGEAFSTVEIESMTGMDAHRIKAAGESLAAGNFIKAEEDYYWVAKNGN